MRSPMAVPGGGLVLLYQTFVGGPDVEWQGVTTSVTVCEHTTCSEVGATVELHPVEAGEDGTPFSGALGPDGLVRLVWTTVEGFRRYVSIQFRRRTRHFARAWFGLDEDDELTF